MTPDTLQPEIAPEAGPCPNGEVQRQLPVNESAAPILSGVVGTNADLFPNILQLYVPAGAIVADVTFGRGVFWRNVDTKRYQLKATDLQNGVDFRSLPYASASIDALILDIPYMHGPTATANTSQHYKNQNSSHESVVRLCAGGILEAARVLKRKGRIVVKTQDEIESGRQRHTHIEIIQLLEILGFRILDTFVLVQSSKPPMREKYQKSARKNHSYAIVAELRR